MRLPAFSRRKGTRRVVAAMFALVVALTIGWCFWAGRGTSVADAAGPPRKLEDIPFNGQRAYASLKELCTIGPRPSGSPGMGLQQKLLITYFEGLHGQVEQQRFSVKHPRDNVNVTMTNILVHWHPEAKKRILLCAHYDTLPYPLRDENDPQGRFVGANDNASGVAVLLEMAHDMPTLRCKYGVDFLLLDGEELVFDTQTDPFFLGSRYFAEQYVQNPPSYRYRWAVLLDMVGDADLQIYQERNSARWADTRPLVNDIWATAARLGVQEFIAKPKHEMEDDHLMLHEIGHIPCIDIIDFDYPAWHTQGDVPERCSALSLAKVGWVIEEWLKRVQ
jgi:hypothetical protein